MATKEEQHLDIYMQAAILIPNSFCSFSASCPVLFLLILIVCVVLGANPFKCALQIWNFNQIEG